MKDSDFMAYIIKPQNIESNTNRVNNLDDTSKKTNNGKFPDEYYPSANAVLDKLNSLLNIDGPIIGRNGDSAYDIAKKNGFDGTEKEWNL